MFKLLKNSITGLAMCCTVAISTSGYASTDGCSIFNESQRALLQAAYEQGKPRNYGYSLAAMAWKESSAGVQPINWNDPSFGPYHALIKTVSNRYKAKDQYEEFALASRLMHDFKFASEAAMDELDFWNKVHKGNWMKIWQGYNGGYSNSRDSKTHANNIAGKVRFLIANKCVI